MLGVVGTAAVALVVLNLSQPVQTIVYALFYLRVGPSEATETAILAHFRLASVVALSVSLLVGESLSDRGANLPMVAGGIAALVSLVLVFLLLSLVGLAAFLTAILVLAVGLGGVPLVLRYWVGVRSGALPAFVGGIPVVVLFLLLARFGIGWGYVVVAEEVPETPVNGSVADFSEIPEVRGDLFVDGNCETTADGDRRCLLQLRGYEHEGTATRFMAQ